MSVNTEWIDVTVVHMTDAAVLVTNGKREAWLPKSEIVDEEDDLVVGVATRIEVPVWLLEAKELV